MICVLCSAEDTHALWLTARLQARGRQVALVLPEELLIGSKLHLHLDTAAIECSVQLARGFALSQQCDGIINRLDSLPPLCSVSGRSTDSAYIEEEWRAAIVAWLAALSCPVLNRPTGTSLCGTRLGDGHWRYLAGQASLPVQAWSAGPADGLAEPEPERHTGLAFVVAGDVIDPQDILSVRARHSVAALAATARLPLCCAEFDQSSGEPRLLRLNPLAPFAAGGDELVAAIEMVFGLS